MLEEGLKWLQEYRHQFLGVPVTIGGVELQATISSEEATSTSSNVTMQRQVYRFIFRKKDLEENNIQLYRGLIIDYNGRKFEVVYDGKVMFEFNDPLENDVIVKATPLSTKI